LSQKKNRKKKKMTINYYVGWTGTPWRTDLMPEPTAPANYKDPAKIAAVVAEKREKLHATAGGTAVYGKLETVCVLANNGEVLLDHTSGDTYNGVDNVSAAVAFFDFLTSTFVFPTDGHQLISGSHPAQLYGVGVKDALQITAMQVLGEQLVSPESVPYRMWYHRTYCADPVAMVSRNIPSLGVNEVLRFFGDEPLGAAPAAQDLAQAARTIATRTGLAHTSDVTVAEDVMV